VRRVPHGELQMPEVVEVLQDNREVVAEAAAASSVGKMDTWLENVQKLVMAVKDVEETAVLNAVKEVIWLVNAQRRLVIVVSAAIIVAVSNAERMVTWLVNVQTPKTKTLVVVDVEVVDALATNATKKVTWPKNVPKQVVTTITETQDNLTSDQDVMMETASKQMTMHGATQKVTSKQMAGAMATPKEIPNGDGF
jgi:hypothetical protein